MAGGDKFRASNTPTRILFVVLFAFLLLFGTTVQAMHFHPDGASMASSGSTLHVSFSLLSLPPPCGSICGSHFIGLV